MLSLVEDREGLLIVFSGGSMMKMGIITLWSIVIYIFYLERIVHFDDCH